MRNLLLTRRDILKGTTALAATDVRRAGAARAPPAEAITPALVEAAKKEGKCSFYHHAWTCSSPRSSARSSGHGIRASRVRVERSKRRARCSPASARKYASNDALAVDVVNTRGPVAHLHRLEAQQRLACCSTCRRRS